MPGLYIIGMKAGQVGEPQAAAENIASLLNGKVLTDGPRYHVVYVKGSRLESEFFAPENPIRHIGIETIGNKLIVAGGQNASSDQRVSAALVTMGFNLTHLVHPYSEYHQRWEPNKVTLVSAIEKIVHAYL